MTYDTHDAEFFAPASMLEAKMGFEVWRLQNELWPTECPHSTNA
jgi:hypothetical protein